MKATYFRIYKNKTSKPKKQKTKIQQQKEYLKIKKILFFKGPSASLTVDFIINNDARKECVIQRLKKMTANLKF